MKIKKYLLLASVGLMAVACQDKKEVEPTPTGSEGDEVVFGAAIGESADSRTIYGDETNTGIKINWLGDDQMIVASPQGCDGRKVADYGVNPQQMPTATSQSPYAGTLVRKGDVGVQWGTSPTADFYSIYPQLTDEDKFGTAYKVTTDDYHTFNIKTQEIQTCEIEYVKEKNGVDKPKMTTADMYSCFMYAKNEGAVKGDSVRLTYTPFSTAIRFTLEAPAETGTFTIDQIKLNAPTGYPISGSYTVDLETMDTHYPDYPTVAPVTGKSSTTATMQPRGAKGDYLQLQSSQKIELNIFIMLESGKTYDISKDGWTLSVLVNNELQTMKLDGKTGGTGVLEPGKIYRLPEFKPLKNEDWDITKWMSYIPRNVYLSEISIPGSWNSLNQDSQPDNRSVDDQYNDGIRAFHFDIRWQYDKKSSLGTFVPSENCVRLAIADGVAANDDVAPNMWYTGQGRAVANTAPTLINSLKELVKRVRDDEYLVAICDLAQDSYDFEGHDETTEIASRKTWYQQIAEDIEAVNTATDLAADKRNRIYNASTITKNTVVGDVLGKVIVIVSMESALSDTRPKPRNDAKCLYVVNPMKRTSTMYDASYNTNVPMIKYNGSWTNIGVSLNATHSQVTSNTGSNINHNERGFAPSISTRSAVNNRILNWSKTNYSLENYDHDAWIYLGLGGYQVRSQNSGEVSGSYATIAKEYNNWINTRINTMGSERQYYPVGIVLMNRINKTDITNLPTTEIVKNILLLNSRYQKAFDPNKSPIDGSPIVPSQVQSAAPGYSSGVNDNNQNAISSN